MGIKDINIDDYNISYQDYGNVITLTRKIKYPTWNDLNKICGVFISIDSEIRSISNSDTVESERNVFFTEKQAKSALAMAQISQLIPYYGGEITNDEWEDNSIKKYVIFRDVNHINTAIFCSNYEFLAFHTEEQRNEFLNNNEQLVKDYLMIE